MEPLSKSRLSQETNGGSQFGAPGDLDRHRRTESVSIVNLLPPEIRALTDFLREGSRLHTPGLFVNSAEQAFAAASEATSSSRVPAPVRTIREALDRGLPVRTLFTGDVFLFPQGFAGFTGLEGKLRTWYNYFPVL